MSRNRYEPAFPRIDGIEQSDPGLQHVHTTDGLTKREIFAAMAMQRLTTFRIQEPNGYKRCAEDSVKFADALLDALEGEK